VIGYPSRNTPRAAGVGAAPAVRLGPHALLLGAVLLLTIVAFVRPVIDPDYWMHVRVGRWILENGRLPGHDLFTYTVPDHRWVDHEWLTQVLFWLIHSHLGPLGVSLAVGALTWAGMLLVLAAARPSRQPYVITGLAIVLAALAGGPIWGPRPQMFTFFFVCLELLWLRRSLEGTSRAIRWLPLVMVLWSNLHGGWPIAFVFLGVALLTEALRWLADRSRREHLEQVRLLALVTAASAVAVLVNPNGPAIVAYPLQTVGSAAQQNLIQEWLSPDFHMAALQPFGAMLLLVVAGLAFGRPSLFDGLLALTGIGLALDSDRHIPLFVAATTPVLVACWADVWRRLRPDGAGGPAVLAAAAAPGTARASRWMPAATLVALALVAGVAVTRTGQALAGQQAVFQAEVPVGAADWLALHPRAGTRMYNQYSWGSYLAYRFYPESGRRVYVFTEGVVMGDAQFYRYERVASLQPGWRRELDGTGVDYVVYNRGSALDDALATQPDWRQVYHDSTAVIYVRVGTPGA
jgi:hypothetical protein